METEHHLDLDNLLLMFEESWNSETEIYLNHLEMKKRGMEKIVSLQKEVDSGRFNVRNFNDQVQCNCNQLEEIYHSLKAKETLYDNYLRCTIFHEQPNVYKTSFLNDDSSVRGWIRLKHEQTKNKWTVLEMQPSSRVQSAMDDQVFELRDTQSFLCHFRRSLFDT